MEGALVERSGDCDRDVRDSLSSVFPRQEDPAAGFRLALLALLTLDTRPGLISPAGPVAVEG